MEFTFDQVKELLEKTLQTTQHNNERLIDSFSQRITEFNYDPDNNKELNRLVDLKVISPLTYSEWAAPIVVIRNVDGSLRICADFSTGLNDCLQLHQHPLPLPEDIFSTLIGGCIFLKLDLAEAYLQVEVAKSQENI